MGDPSSASFVLRSLNRDLIELISIKAIGYPIFDGGGEILINSLVANPSETN
jgi:hypothetical protein